MDNTQENIKNILKLSLKKKSLIGNDSHTEINEKSSKMLLVKYEYLNQNRVVNLSRPVQFEELYKKISTSLKHNNELILHYMSPNKEIFGEISTQSHLEHIVQFLEQNPKFRSLHILVTILHPLRINSTPMSQTPSDKCRSDSPPPGCLHPNDRIQLGRSTSFPVSHVDGEFIPEDDTISTSHSGDSSYSSGRQSLLDGIHSNGNRRQKRTNSTIYPDLPENGNGANYQRICTFPLRIHPSPYSKQEGRQTLPRLQNQQNATELSSGQGSSRGSSNISSDYERNLFLPEKTMTRPKAPSLTSYKKGPLLGRGGFGQVFKCLDSQSGREFAMKEVLLGSNGSYSKDTGNKDAVCLENEINIYRELMWHQRIVQYFGAKMDANSMYIFMEYMPGGSVKDQLKQYGPLSHNIIIRYVKQILQGLAFLHQKMIIHRDIKAANILRDTDGNVKLSDFGASRYLKSISVHNGCHRTGSNISTSDKKKSCEVVNSFCGTFFWMAPEVIRGESYSISADVWSLGATIVEMLTGYPPYHDLEPFAALFKIANTNKIEYQCPEPACPELETLMSTMFLPNPHDRATAETLLRSHFIANLPSN